MALRNQGFERGLNLGESVDDRQILNNLAGGNVQLDIALFRNNKRNTSTLVWPFNINGSSIDTVNRRFVFPTNVPFTFTTGDEVKVSGSSLGSLNSILTYYVVDYTVGLGQLRNQSAFALALTKGGPKVVLGSIGNSVTFIRKDEVNQENIFNIATPDTLEQGVSREATRFRYDIGGTFTAGFDNIDSNIDIANFTRTQKYTLNTSVATSRQIRIEGVTIVDDPANFNTSTANLANTNSPGAYITDPFASVLNISKTRAYSTNDQPWTEGAGKIDTKSAQVNIGDLYFQNGINFDSFDGVSVVTGNVSDATIGFTHKLPIRVNGVDYFVLLRQI